MTARDLSWRWLALVLCAARPAVADDAAPPRHAVAASAGMRGDSVREDLVVPLTFSGPGVRFSAGYRGELGPGLLAANGEMGMAFLWNRFGDQAVAIDHDVDVAWTVPVRRTGTSHWAVGPMIALDGRFNYLFSWDDAHAYWLAAQWLGPAARYGRRLGERWRLEARASLALVGWEGRPPTYRYRKQETRPSVTYPFTQPYGAESFVTPADLQLVRLDVAVRHSPYTGSDVGRGWSFGLDTRFARTGIPVTNINLSVCIYAARAWGMR
jgi:hypothetical protein